MKNKSIKAFKIFNHDWTCNGFQYEVGKEYTFDGDIEIYEKGFHACLRLVDCFKYYKSVTWNKLAEVEILGKSNKEVATAYKNPTISTEIG